MRTRSSLPLLLLLASLGACNAYNGVETPKVPTIAAQSLSHVATFTADNKLSPGEAASLEAFLASSSPRYGDSFALDDPKVEGAPERRAVLASAIARLGLRVEPALAMTSEPLNPGSVRLIISRTTASVIDCPDWSQTTYDRAATTPMGSNFGCANRGNLAAMIADPTELDTPKAYSGPDGASITKGIEAWRKQEPSLKQGLQSTSTATPSGQ